MGERSPNDRTVTLPIGVISLVLISDPEEGTKLAVDTEGQTPAQMKAMDEFLLKAGVPVHYRAKDMKRLIDSKAAELLDQLQSGRV